MKKMNILQNLQRLCVLTVFLFVHIERCRLQMSRLISTVSSETFVNFDL